MNNNNTEAGPKRKLDVWLPLLFAITSVISILVGFQLRSSTGTATSNATVLPTLGKRAGVGKLEEMLRYIESKYCLLYTSDAAH